MTIILTVTMLNMTDKELLLLEKLKGILNARLSYMKAYTKVDVNVEIREEVLRASENGLEKVPIEPTEYVVIKYYKPKLDYLNKQGFEQIEFPVVDLPFRVAHYLRKLEKEKTKFFKRVSPEKKSFFEKLKFKLKTIIKL